MGNEGEENMFEGMEQSQYAIVGHELEGGTDYEEDIIVTRHNIDVVKTIASLLESEIIPRVDKKPKLVNKYGLTPGQQEILRTQMLLIVSKLEGIVLED